MVKCILIHSIETTGAVLRATLVFEEDYEINVDGYNLLIEKHIEINENKD